MKKISQWLEELPEPYRTQAKKNQNNDMEVSTLKDALLAAFFWNDSPQKHDYWNDFFDCLP